MNKLKNIGIQEIKGYQSGSKITLAGGENYELQKIAQNEELIRRIPLKTSELTHEVEGIGREKLNELYHIVRKRVRIIDRLIRSFGVNSEKLQEEYFLDTVSEIQGYLPNEEIIAISSLDIKRTNSSYKELVSRKKVLSLLRTKMNLKLMNRRRTAYEVNKGGKMKKGKRISIKEVVDEFGRVIDHKILYNKDVSFHKNGELLQRDKLTLHYSGRLAIKINGELVPTNTLNGTDVEGAFFEGLKEVEAFVIFPSGNRTLNFRTRAIPLEEVKRRVFNRDDDCQNGLAEIVYKKYRGSKFGFEPIGIWNKTDHCLDYLANVLSFNYVDFEENYIVLIGPEQRLEQIDKEFEEANKEGCFYNFTGKEYRPFDKNFKGKVFQDEYFSKDGDFLYCNSLSGVIQMFFELKGAKKGFKKFNRCNTVPLPLEILPNILSGKERKDTREFRRTSKGKIGIVGLDKELQKMLDKTEQVRPQPTRDEAKELIEIAYEQDGRLNQFNLEHSLRFELRDLKTRTSNELFFLLKDIEEELFLPYNKKEKALINVIEGFKSSIEIHEHEGKGLTSDLKDLVTQEKTWNDESHKRSKNLYSLKLGLLIPNQNPQDMKDLSIQEFESSTFIGSSEQIRMRDKAEKLLVQEKVVEDGKHNKVVTYEEVLRAPNKEITNKKYFYRYIKADTKSGRLNGGSSRYLKPTKPTPLPYMDVPVYEYHRQYNFPINSLCKTLLPGLIRQREERLGKENIKKWGWGRDVYLEAYNEIEGCLRFTRNPFLLSEKYYEAPNLFKELKTFIESFKEEEVNVSKGERISGVYRRNSKRNLTKLSEFEESINKPQRVQGPDLPSRYIPTRATNTPNFGVFTPSSQYLGKSKRIDLDYAPQTKIRIHRPYTEGFRGRADALDYKDYGKHIDHVVYHPFYRKNLGKNSRLRRELSSPSSPTPSKSRYNILEEENGIYKIIIEGIEKPLYAKGNLKALDSPSISMAGTRKPSKETRAFITKSVLNFVKKGFATVSGLAIGCDAIAHEATLVGNGITIAILPTGINNIHPKKNRRLAQNILNNNGLLLSEHPPECGYKGKWMYSARNEFIAALSDIVTIFEAGNGTMNTFTHAKKQNKEILVQPCNNKNNEDILNNGDGDILLI